MSKGFPTFSQAPDNEMNKANLHYNSAKSQQIAIKARIVKLQKEEEKAIKRINDTKRQQEFYERINSIKNQKYSTKFTFNREMKMKEEQNRINFNQRRMEQTFLIKRNKQKFVSFNRHIA